MEIDPRHGDYMPVNQYNTLRKELTGRRAGFHRQLPARPGTIHSKEELECVRKAGKLCQNAAWTLMIASAHKPCGVKEYELRRLLRAAAIYMDGGGDVDFSDHRLDADGQSSADLSATPRPSGSCGDAEERAT